jgi:predicted membrane protein
MKQTATRITTGIIILAIGVGALLGALNLIPFWSWFSNLWPILVIVAGLFVLLGDFRRNYIWGIAIILVGVLLQLKAAGVVDFNFFSLIVPIGLIAAGLTVLLHVQNRPSIKAGSNDVDDISVIFSGSESKNKSANYQGGRITAIFGGAVLDLRDAKIQKEAVLDVFTVCGGVEIRVPRDWKVISKAAPIAGGVENKSEGNEDHKGPVLIVTGTVALGGVEIKT